MKLPKEKRKEYVTKIYDKMDRVKTEMSEFFAEEKKRKLTSLLMINNKSR